MVDKCIIVLYNGIVDKRKRQNKKRRYNMKTIKHFESKQAFEKWYITEKNYKTVILIDCILTDEKLTIVYKGV